MKHLYYDTYNAFFDRYSSLKYINLKLLSGAYNVMLTFHHAVTIIIG